MSSFPLAKPTSGPNADHGLLERIQEDFHGLDTHYRIADGTYRRRVYLDSAATTLMMRSPFDTASEFLAHYSNTHSGIHSGSRISTEVFEDARAAVLDFVNADPDRYTAVFVGSGATAALNAAAHHLGHLRPEGEILVSLMEHHSNDLPHRRLGAVRHLPMWGNRPSLAALDLGPLQRAVSKGPIRYVALTLASNVTGIINPIAEVATALRQHDIPFVVDASQAIAHSPVDLEKLGHPDVLVFSGHKVYAPGSPGVMVIRRRILEESPPFLLGGGMVDDVTKRTHQFVSNPAHRAEAGTPNIFGTVLLAGVLEVLKRIGMEQIAAREHELTRKLLDAVAPLPGLRLYGSTDPESTPRTGVVTFNLGSLDHGLVAAALNDHFGIAVRNRCFCAHPYVRDLLLEELWSVDVSGDPVETQKTVDRKRGMVRASLGLYSTPEDIEALANALGEIAEHPTYYLDQYTLDDAGNYRHRTLQNSREFNLAARIEARLHPNR